MVIGNVILIEPTLPLNVQIPNGVHKIFERFKACTFYRYTNFQRTIKCRDKAWSTEQSHTVADLYSFLFPISLCLLSLAFNLSPQTATAPAFLSS